MTERLHIVPHEHAVSAQDREQLNGHRGHVLWFTGLSGSGKSTLASAVEKELHRLGIRTFILDGDNVRVGLNSDLGFDAALAKRTSAGLPTSVPDEDADLLC